MCQNRGPSKLCVLLVSLQTLNKNTLKQTRTFANTAWAVSQLPCIANLFSSRHCQAGVSLGPRVNRASGNGASCAHCWGLKLSGLFNMES